MTILRARAALPAIVLPLALATVLASCMETAGLPESRPVPSAAACSAPLAILAGPSPFEMALDLWSREPVGSTRALAALDAACEAAPAAAARGTEHAACAVLALMYVSGEGVARDPRTAFRYFGRGAQCGMSFDAVDLSQAEHHAIRGNAVGCCGGRSCDAGCEDACERAASAVQAAIVPPIERACAAGRGVGCFLLSQLVGADRGEYIQGIGYVRSSVRLSDEALWERACGAGMGPACELMAYRSGDDGKRRDRYYQRACDLGWGDACLKLGMEREKAGAIPYWEMACRLGLTRVCSEVAEMLSNGDGVMKDPQRAAALEAEAWRAQ